MNKKQILVVEDESIVAMELHTRLQDLGYAVLDTCISGEQALKAVRNEHLDLVLMDIMLRGEMDGIETAKQIKQMANVPVIFLTAYADVSTLDRAKQAEPYGYLIKPFQERELRSTIEMALYKHAIEYELEETKQWLYTTLQSIGDGVIATDNQQRVTLINPVAESITGWKRSEAIGKPVTDIFNIIDEITEEDILNPALKALKTGTAVDLSNHTLLVNKHGDYIPIDDSAAPIRNERDDVIGSVLVFKDISTLKQQLQDLRVKNYAIESSINGIVIADLTGTITYANQSFLDGWGFQTVEEVIGRTIHEFWKSTSEARNIYESVKREGYWIGELIAKREDGSEFDVQLSASEVLDSVNQPICVLASVIDISERKNAERALRESEEKYRRLFENNLSAVFRSTPQGELLDCNAAMIEMLGYDSREDILQHKTFDFYPDIKIRQQMIRKIKSENQIKNLEIPLLRKDGKIIWVLENVNLISDPQNGGELLVGNFIDITKQKKAQEKLKKSEKNYRMIFENMQSGLYRVREDGEILMVNPQFADMLEYDSPDELIGKKLADVARSSKSVQKEFRSRIAQKGEVKNFVSTWYTKSNRKIVVTLNAHEAFDADKDIQYYEGMAEDITERLELERQLIQSQKMESLGEIAGGIAHDFNNVMATISGAIQIMDSQLENDQLRKYSNMIISSIERGKTITNRMLTFTRNDQPEYQPISAMDFLQNVKTIVEHSLPKNITFRISDYDGADQIFADKGQLQHVLINMCINSSQAMPDGGAITLAIKKPTHENLRKYAETPEKNYLCISITDTGHGMDQKTMDRIFDPFYTTKGPGKGTGLGLSVAQKIIRNHKGWITVESTPGQGTTFNIALPATEKSIQDSATEKPLTGIKGHGETILIVDDEESIRKLLGEVLSNYNYEVLLAKSGKEALELFENHSEAIRLVVTDLGLPEIPGTALARKLRQQKPELPIIGNTGYLSVNEKKALEELGFTRVVQKPFKVNEILEIISNNLHRKR